ncbi:MAG: CotH kinase family protein, partial [Lachnospiraceae bacterium]|nr:CotH kinase family protein [Lachnospiraceae bacterium]
MKLKTKRILILSLLTAILAVLSVIYLYHSGNRHSSLTAMDSLYFYYNDAVSIRLSPAGIDNVYNLFVPGCAHDELMIGYHPGETGKVVINDEFFIESGENILPYIRDISDDGNPYVSIRLLSVAGKEIFNGYINFFFAGNIPSVYINVSEAGIDGINSENPEERLSKLHVSGIMTVVDPDGLTDTHAEIDMSRRGNTSFIHMDVKPYNINLKQPVSILGMRQGKKYAFKANSYDMNHLLRTEAAFDMARLTNMSMMFDSRFADLYINGTYNGLYLITNRIKGDELLELPDIPSKPDETGYLLELDYRYENEKNFFISHDQGIVVHYPEEPDSGQMSYIENRYNKAYEVIAANEDYEKYIDVDSFVKMYIIQDFLCNVDVDYASFYVYLGEDGLFHAGPIWDLDLACGIMQTLPFHEELALRSHIIPDRGGIFLDILGESPRFMDKVSSYY